MPEALKRHGDAVVGWNGESIADAIDGASDEWRQPDGSAGTTVPSNAMPADKMPCLPGCIHILWQGTTDRSESGSMGFCTLATCKPQIRKKAEMETDHRHRLKDEADTGPLSTQ